MSLDIKIKPGKVKVEISQVYMRILWSLLADLLAITFELPEDKITQLSAVNLTNALYTKLEKKNAKIEFQLIDALLYFKLYDLMITECNPDAGQKACIRSISHQLHQALIDQKIDEKWRL